MKNHRKKLRFPIKYTLKKLRFPIDAFIFEIFICNCMIFKNINKNYRKQINSYIKLI